MELDKHKAGLVFGSVMGLWHLVWSLLVAGNFAQRLLNWIYQIHFLNNPFQVADFVFVRAVVLIVVTAVIGYVVGWVFAVIWNRLHRAS